jgi:PAS domain S-box-containing protein|tara:strand:- start:302 stop:556 length:255 start_codon:yes stop_codon:yes gene_type:complete
VPGTPLFSEESLPASISRIIGIGREPEGRRTDGTVFSTNLTTREMRVASRRPATGMMRDITERALRERELRMATGKSQRKEMSQ